MIATYRSSLICKNKITYIRICFLLGVQYPERSKRNRIYPIYCILTLVTNVIGFVPQLLICVCLCVCLEQGVYPAGHPNRQELWLDMSVKMMAGTGLTRQQVKRLDLWSQERAQLRAQVRQGSMLSIAGHFEFGVLQISSQKLHPGKSDLNKLFLGQAY